MSFGPGLVLESVFGFGKGSASLFFSFFGPAKLCKCRGRFFFGLLQRDSGGFRFFCGAFFGFLENLFILFGPFEGIFGLARVGSGHGRSPSGVKPGFKIAALGKPFKAASRPLGFSTVFVCFVGETAAFGGSFFEQRPNVCQALFRRGHCVFRRFPLFFGGLGPETGFSDGVPRGARVGSGRLNRFLSGSGFRRAFSGESFRRTGENFSLFLGPDFFFPDGKHRSGNQFLQNSR